MKIELLSTVLQYARTQRGRIMLIHNGYKYVENRQSAKNTFWRCSRYVKFGCRASCVTSKDPDEYPPIRLSGTIHTHSPEKNISDIPKDTEIKFLAVTPPNN
jgi:hypothetical protein